MELTALRAWTPYSPHLGQGFTALRATDTRHPEPPPAVVTPPRYRPFPHQFPVQLKRWRVEFEHAARLIEGPPRHVRVSDNQEPGCSGGGFGLACRGVLRSRVIISSYHRARLNTAIAAASAVLNEYRKSA